MRKILHVLAFLTLSMELAQCWDYAVSAEDRLEFYINDTITDSVRLHSQNPTALAYDEVHNMLLYVDKQSGGDAICGYNISSVEYKCYVKRSGRDIQGLAYDPITQYLFFTDTKEKSINWISFQPGSNNHVNGNLLIKMDEGTPTDIVVDSCRGYIYWINTRITKSSIERARLDGSAREVLIHATYEMDLHSLAIDQQTKKIYWMSPRDNTQTYFYSADLNGKNYESPISYKSGGNLAIHPNIFTVSKKTLFVVDWCGNCGLRNILKYPTSAIKHSTEVVYQNLVNTEDEVGLVANSKIAQEFEGIQECQFLIRLVPPVAIKVAREYETSSCAHGVKVNGQCAPGFTGDQCEVSVCHNYCLNGNCSFNDEGLPDCSCNTGFAGDRCEVDACLGYCLNNGSCDFDEEGDPSCTCPDNYIGDRCEIISLVSAGVQRR